MSVPIILASVIGGTAVYAIHEGAGGVAAAVLWLLILACAGVLIHG